MNIAQQIALDKFKPRSYQKNIINAILNKKIKRVLAINPRRSGKDICGFQVAFHACLMKIGTVFYVFPTFSSGRRILWDAITNDGHRILDYVPKELIESRNEQLMRIRFHNGSQLQIIGSDSFDSTLVGTNPMGIVFSEYALQDPRAYQFAIPILKANNGWALFLSTPRGHNHLYDLYQIAINNPDIWYTEKLTLEDTKHIPIEEIEELRRTGEMSEDLIQQEFYCSFDMGIEGSYYAKYIDRLRLKGQISLVPYEPTFKVHTAWDLGYSDSMSIIFYQTVGQTVRIIDYYENSKQGLPHYINIVLQKEYTYGKHIAPHDISVHELGTGQTRLETARRLGISFTIASNIAVEDGIESCRAAFNKIWIDEVKCSKLIKCLENYRQEFDIKKKIYKPRPLHDWSSHAADAFRYLCISLPKTKDGLSSEDLDKRYQEAMLGNSANLPPMFRDDQKFNYY